jgi:superfamily II DNA or RNA helicase
MLHVPRFYGLERFGDAEIDERTEGDEIKVEFNGTLTPIQERAIQTNMKRCYSSNRQKGCITVLPCGFGKTVKALKLASMLGRKTIVFVHKTILADQWIERIGTFLPNARIGRVQGDIFDIDADIVIAMVLTVAKRGFKISDFDSFGFAIFDECHHMAARVMNSATLLLNAKYVLGMTATKERVDGLTQLLHWSLGPEGFKHEGRTEITHVTCMTYVGSAKEIYYRDGQPAMSLMINNIAKDEQRTLLIARRMNAYYNSGRTIIVLSDRIQQLKSLCTMLLALGMPTDDIGYLIGSTPKNDRPGVLEKRVLMCTYSMANEGLDKKQLDCLIMATPKGNCIQAIGRIQRPCEGKKIPLVLDIVDNHSIFGKLGWKRRNFYSQNNYVIQTFESSNAHADCFL